MNGCTGFCPCMRRMLRIPIRRQLEVCNRLRFYPHICRKVHLTLKATLFPFQARCWNSKPGAVLLSGKTHCTILCSLRALCLLPACIFRLSALLFCYFIRVLGFQKNNRGLKPTCILHTTAHTSFQYSLFCTERAACLLGLKYWDCRNRAFQCYSL